MAARKRDSNANAKRGSADGRPVARVGSREGAFVEPEWFPGDDDADPEDSARDRRHPGALSQDEEEHRRRPVDDESYGRPLLPRSGTLSSLGDTDRLPVVESGFPVEPEDFGRQFLSSATQQDNFESEVRWDELERGSYSLGQVISESTMEASGQEGFEIPESGSFGDARADADLEPPDSDFDLRQDAVHETSLFDRRFDELEGGDGREHADIESAGGARDLGSARDEGARELEAAQTRETLEHGRGGQGRPRMAKTTIVPPPKITRRRAKRSKSNAARERRP